MNYAYNELRSTMNQFLGPNLKYVRSTVKLGSLDTNFGYYEPFSNLLGVPVADPEKDSRVLNSFSNKNPPF